MPQFRPRAHTEDDFNENVGWREKLRRLIRRAPIVWDVREVGERMLVTELEPLEQMGYRLFHSRHVPGIERGVVDSIVVGPPGVFLLDAKHWLGEVIAEHGKLYQVRRTRRERTPDITKLLAASKKIGQVTHTYINPFLILTGEAQVKGGEFVSKVRVRNLPGTAEFLTQQIQTLSADDVGRLATLIDHNFPAFTDADAVAQASTRGVPQPSESSYMDAPSTVTATPAFAASSAPEPPAYEQMMRPDDTRQIPPVTEESANPPKEQPQRSGLSRFISIPALPGASIFHQGRNRQAEQESMPEPPVSTWNAQSSGEQNSYAYEDSQYQQRGRKRKLLAVALSLALIIGVVSLFVVVARGVQRCGILSDDQASSAWGSPVEGKRRWRGGCVFSAADGEENEVFQVFIGGSAESRADGRKGIVTREDPDCGMVVVATENARVASGESIDQRKITAATCVAIEGKSTKDSRAKAAAKGKKIVAALRKAKVADN